MAGVYNGCRGYPYPEIYADKQKEHVVQRSRVAVDICVGTNNVGIEGNIEQCFKVMGHLYMYRKISRVTTLERTSNILWVAQTIFWICWKNSFWENICNIFAKYQPSRDFNSHLLISSALSIRYRLTSQLPKCYYIIPWFSLSLSKFTTDSCLNVMLWLQQHHFCRNNTALHREAFGTE